MQLPKIIERYSFKSTALDGALGRHTIVLAEDGSCVIYKYLLTADDISYGFKSVRKFWNKTLWLQIIAMKADTMLAIVSHNQELLDAHQNRTNV